MTPPGLLPAPSPLSVFAPALFEGKTALVTGGGRGIGRAIALGFAQLGANVVIASRKLEHLQPTQREIEALGVQCLAVPMSIRETEQVEALVEAADARFGGIDCLINNAGGQFPARPWEISDRGFRAVVDLNLHGTWNMCNRVGTRMIRHGSGAIVNSVAASFDLWEQTKRWCQERVLFGKPLSKMQVTQFKLVDLLTQLTAARELTHACIRQRIAGQDATLDISMAKLFCGRAVRTVADECIQLHGGLGYMKESAAGRAFVDSRLMSIGAGADETMMHYLSKLLGL